MVLIPGYIILAEDEPAHAEAICRVLYSVWPECKVDTARSISEYWSLVEKKSPDIALLDLKMPDGNAAELLCNEPGKTGFPKLAITSYGTEQIAADSIKKGALDYVVKTPENIRDIHNKIRHALTHWQMLQDKVRSDEEIRLSEERFRTIAENALDIIARTGIDCRFLFINKAVRAKWGIDPLECMGKTIHEIGIPGQVGQVWDETLREVFATGKSKTAMFRLDRAGQKRYFHSILVPEKDENGSMLTVLSITRDITDQLLVEETLRESEKKYRTLVENAREAIMVALDGSIVFCNQAAIELTGFTDKQMVGASITGLFHAEDRGVISKLQDEPCTGSGRVNNLRLLHKYDETKLVELSRVSTRWQGKDASLYFFNDLSSLLKLQQERQRLLKSEMSYRFLFENMLNGLAYCKADASTNQGFDFTFIEVNDSFLKKTGLKQVSGKKASQVVPEYNEANLDFCKRCCEVAFKGGPDSFEMYLAGLDKWISASVYSPESGYFVLDFDVINERKEAERAITNAAQEWRMTFDSMEDMIAIIGADMRIIRVNRVFAEAAGSAPQELLGKHCYEVVHGLGQPHPECMFRSALEQAGPALNEFFEPYLGRHLENRLWPLIDKSREARGVVHVFRDVTRRKELEAEQKALQEKAELSSRLATIGEMASGIAHEINNPLTSVIGFSEMLLQEDVSPELEDSLKYIVDGSRRVKDIVKRMLTFARQTKPFKTRLDIHQLIDNTVEMRSYVLKTANIEVVRNYEKHLPWVTVDPGQLQQVFLNLVVNAEFAIKKNSSSGKLVITTRKKQPGGIIIEIRDDGPGIPRELLPRLFDPFFTTREPGEGTGLGLSLTRSIILEHGGDIEVESKPGAGAAFIITLPVVSHESKENNKAEADEALILEKGSKILIIDDEVSTRLLVEKVFEKYGCPVTGLGDASKAVEMVGENHFDIIYIDIRMPEVSGLEIYDQIAEKYPEKVKRAILVTADALDSGNTEYIKEKGIPCIFKPFDHLTLVKQTSQILAGKKNRPSIDG